MKHFLLLGIILTMFCLSMAIASLSAVAGEPDLLIRSFLPDKPIDRAGRPTSLRAIIANNSASPVTVEAKLIAPDSVQADPTSLAQTVRIDSADEAEIAWNLQSDKEGEATFTLEVSHAGKTIRADLAMAFREPLPIEKRSYIPEPKPVKTDMLIGAHHCPLWEADKPNMWAQILKHPERTPALGFYDQANPEISDWETKWATEHGINFFIYCWYRASQGGAVKMNFGSAIHDGLFKSRYADKMKFTIMWENQSRGIAGVQDEKDLMENLLPFWIENYFKHPSYVKVNNKPLLFIYRPEFLIDDLGGEEKVVQAFDKMRAACKANGFDGLYLLGEYRGMEIEHLELMKRLGLDYTFAYCWYVPDNPTPERAIESQLEQIRKTQEMGILPQLATVSQAWSGWADEGTIWKIPPPQFKTLLEQARDIVAGFPDKELSSHTLLLDNWNEWGEGHYIAPYREYGFDYLDAVREVFAKDPEPHTDLIPEDIGMGPYDTAYKAFSENEKRMRRKVSQRILKKDPPEKGLVGWWVFDAEEEGASSDFSGNRQGGVLRNASLVEGIDGKALLCKGGCMEVINSPRLSVANLTLSCWVKSDAAGQGNNWFINRIFGGGTSTGYRMGILDGKPCFEVPFSEWSHHLKADIDLPVGRWTHLAGTYDGKTLRIYVDGMEHGSMAREGVVNANQFNLCLGNFAVGHQAFFDGILDEVKLYDRALCAEEVRLQFEELAPRVK